MENKKPDLKLTCEYAARGLTVAMDELTGIQYYGYDHIQGVDVPLILEAKASSSPAFTKTVGDFYRAEHQEETADKYYKQALSNSLKEAESGDGAAQYCQCEQYAFGEGTEQDHEKAYFWCLQGAYNGSKDAFNMMQNFWQDGGAVPVSAEMAQAWQKAAFPIKPAQNAAELYSLATEAEFAAEGIQVMQADGGPQRSVRIENLESVQRRKPLAGLKRMISKGLEKLLIVYIVASLICFLVSFFSGYHESGLLNLFNNGFYCMLSLPGKLFLTIISDLKFSQITPELFCKNFAISGFIIGILQFAFSVVVFAVWYFILFALYCTIASMLTPEEMPGIVLSVTPAGKKQCKEYADRKAAYQSRFATAKEKLAAYMEKSGIAGFDSYVSVCALCDIATMMRISLPEAAELYRAWERETQVPTIDIFYGSHSKYASTFMELYFWLRRNGYAYKKAPLMDLGLSSSLLSLSRDYRKGTNYAKTGSDFERLAENSSKPQIERAYAYWYLSRLYNNEFMPDERRWNAEKKTKEAQGKAEKYMETAKRMGCPLADESMALWQRNIYALQMLAERHKDDEKTYNMLCATVKIQQANAKSYGDPLKQAYWNGYKTNNPWPAYLEAEEECSKSHPGTSIAKDGEREAYYNEMVWKKKVVKKLEPFYGKGLCRLDELYKSLSDSIGTAEFVLKQYENNAGSASAEPIRGVPSIITDDMGRNWFLDGAVLGGARYRLQEGSYINPQYDLGDSLGTTVIVSDAEIQKGSAYSIGRTFHW